MSSQLLALRIYLDEDVDVLLEPLLAAHGIDCLTTVAAGNLGHTDEEQLRSGCRLVEAKARSGRNNHRHPPRGHIRSGTAHPACSAILRPSGLAESGLVP